MAVPERGTRTRRPRLLLLSMYPLDQGIWGATARVTHMRDELAKLADLDVVAGWRGGRGVALLRYVLSGRLRRLDGIYVEAATTLPGPADIGFMGLGRALGIPVLTYFRDAQPLFVEYSPRGSPKRRLSRKLFRPAFRALRAVSSAAAYPSAGLAAAFGERRRPLLIPPGAPTPVDIPRSAGANQFLFVGGMRYAVHGLDILIAATERLRAEGIDIGVTCVSRSGEEPPQPRPNWMTVERGSGADIHRLLPRVIATIQPRRRSPYNDLGVPVKVMEYLSYGRPLLVTDCTEQARVVHEARAGVVVADSVDGLTVGMRELACAPAAMLDAYADAAREAARRHSWHARAKQVVEVLMADR